MQKTNMTACPDCDLLVSLCELPNHTYARCPRCSHPLFDNRPHRFDHVLALVITGLMLWLPSNFLPLLQIRLLGHEVGTSIISAGYALIQADYWIVGMMVLFAGAITPLLTLSLLFWVLVGCKRQWNVEHMIVAMKWLGSFRKWTMLEIYLLSFLVAAFKLKDYADIQIGLGFISYLGLFIILLTLSAQYNRHYMWQLIEARRHHA